MKKDIILIFAVVLIIALLISGTKFQSVEEYYLTHAEDIKPGDETVFVSIDCSDILAHYEKLDKSLAASGFVPQDGIILAKTEYVLREGDTAFDVLLRVTRYNRIHME